LFRRYPARKLDRALYQVIEISDGKRQSQLQGSDLEG